MGLFGWDYPPGCSSVPGDEETPCQVCGRELDDCICPECPVCGEQGRDECYEQHGLVRTQEQIDSLREAEESWQRENEERSRAFEAAGLPEEEAWPF